MLHEPLEPDVAEPSKPLPFSVIFTPGMGARVSSRRKPLMLFWNCVGEGEGEGVVACAAGAATSSVARRVANSAPLALSRPLDRLLDRSRCVLLKMETSTVGVVPAAPMRPVRTVTGPAETTLETRLHW